MPLFNSFSESAARGLGVGSGKIMPPEPPVIVTPASGNPIIDTKFSADVLFTPSSPTTYPISSHRYRLIKTSDSSVIVDWTTVPSNPFTISSLVASINYTLYMTAIDNQNVESVSSAGRTFTTKNDVLIQAPIPSLTSPSITYPTSIYIGITYSAGIPTGGDANPPGNTITLRQYAVTTSASTPGAYSTFPDSSGTVNATTTTAGVALTTNTPYYVHFKYTDSTGATNSKVNSITTAAENAPGIPAASTFTKTGTSTATLQRGDATAGTYDRAYQYRYWISDASSSVAATGTWQSMTSNPTYLTGLNSNTYYDAQVKAVNVSPGTQESSPRDYSVIRTDPPAPSTPTISWNSMSANSSVTANIFLPYVSNGGTAYMEISENNFSTSSTLNSVSHFAAFNPDNTNNRFLFNYASGFNKTYYFRAYYKNDVGVNSSYSNTLVWNTPQKGLAYTAYSATGEFAEFNIAATNSAVAGCSPGDYSITFGYVPPSSDDVGYINITSMGIQIKRFVTFTVSSSYLYFSYPGGTFGLGPAQAPEGFYPTANSLRFTSINVGGSSISGQTFRLNYIWDGTNSGAARFANQGYGCLPNGNNAYYGKGLYVQGTYTGAGSSPGYF